jgi:hypothetical protein
VKIWLSPAERTACRRATDKDRAIESAHVSVRDETMRRRRNRRDDVLGCFAALGALRQMQLIRLKHGAALPEADEASDTAPDAGRAAPETAGRTRRRGLRNRRPARRDPWAEQIGRAGS